MWDFWFESNVILYGPSTTTSTNINQSIAFEPTDPQDLAAWGVKYRKKAKL